MRKKNECFCAAGYAGGFESLESKTVPRWPTTSPGRIQDGLEMTPWERIGPQDPPPLREPLGAALRSCLLPPFGRPGASWSCPQTLFRPLECSTTFPQTQTKRQNSLQATRKHQLRSCIFLRICMTFRIRRSL
jgi:hypothetical protein